MSDKEVIYIEDGFILVKTKISFIVDEKGVTQEVTVRHTFKIEKGVIVSQEATITPKGTDLE